jgi:predicted transcriptional regulator
VLEWESVRDRDDINAAIREGLADIEAGRHRPADEVMRELRQKHNIPSE